MFAGVAVVFSLILKIFDTIRHQQLRIDNQREILRLFLSYLGNGARLKPTNLHRSRLEVKHGQKPHPWGYQSSPHIPFKAELFVPFPDDTPVATAKNMPGDSADLFGDGGTEDGSATNGRLWRTVIIGEQEHRIDLQMIKPYMRVVTHGGEHGQATAWLPALLWVPLCQAGGGAEDGF